MVAQEFKRGGDAPELYSPTPPLELFKCMMALAAIGHFDPASWQTSHADPIVVLYTDISRAYFNAPVKSDKYVVIPDEDMEDGDIGKWGKLNFSLYGTREAATNWEKHYSEWMESQSFTRGKAASCAFCARRRWATLYGLGGVHGKF